MSWTTKDVDFSDVCTSVEVLHVTAHNVYCEKERVEYSIDPNTGSITESTVCIKWGQRLMRARLLSVNGAKVSVRVEMPPEGEVYVCVGVVCSVDSTKEYKIKCERV